MSSPSADELREVELFHDLTPRELETVAAWLHIEEASPGQRLTHQDANGYEFTVLREGTAEVTIDGNVVATLGPGDFLGEISLVYGPRQTATVTVTAPAVVWRMFGTTFRQLQQEEPAVAAAIEATAARRRGATSSPG